ncbi:MAG: hypothetical protein ACKVH0_16465 [Alphaproteobacteria bacterium]
MQRTMTPLEQSTLACRRQDAALVRAALTNFWHGFKAGHDPNVDPIERAKLACQKRDVAVLRHGVSVVTHVGGSTNVGGAARA